MNIGPLFQRDFSGAQCNNVNVSLAPASTVELALNLVADEEIGSLVSRLGRATVGAQLVASQAILGLHQHVDEKTAANSKLFATVNASGGATSVIYDVVAGTTSVIGLTASKKMRFVTFLGTTAVINGSNAERSYTSAGWITTAGNLDIANWPSTNTASLCIEFLDRVYTAGDTAQPARLYYSSLPVAGAISWTAGNGYVDVEPEDGGGAITALGKVPGYILIFKERSMKRWNYSSAFPESLIQLGTPSQECVVMAAGLCAFYSSSNENAKGFYLTAGDRPKPISHDTTRPIKKWVDAIPQASEATIAGWATDRGFAWSVGDLTVDGETYLNVVLRYNRLLNQWTVHSYPSEYRAFASYIVSGVNTTVGGDDNGTIYQLDKPGTYSDASTTTTVPIFWKLRQQPLTHGYNQQKTLTDSVVIRAKGAQSARVGVRVDGQEATDLTDRLSDRPISEIPINGTLTGATLAVEIAGETTGQRSYIAEIELPNVEATNTYA